MRRAPATLLRTCVTLAALTAPAIAQSPAGAARVTADTLGPPVGGFVMQGIALTPTQKLQVRAINQRYYDARVALTRDVPHHGAGDADVRAKVRQNLEDMMREERAVLTDGQHARFDRNVAAIRSGWDRASAAAPPATTPSDRADANRRALGGNALDGVALTPDQRARIAEIRRRHHGEQAALRRNHPTRGVGDPVARAALYANNDQMLAEQRVVLTPAQRARFDRNLQAMSESRARVEARVAAR